MLTQKRWSFFHFWKNMKNHFGLTQCKLGIKLIQERQPCVHKLIFFFNYPIFKIVENLPTEYVSLEFEMCVKLPRFLFDRKSLFFFLPTAD